MTLKRKKPMSRQRKPMSRQRKPMRRSAHKPSPAPRAPTELERAFETLELGPGADLAAVRAAYRRLVARSHPDKWAALGAGPRRMAEEHTREIVCAYELVVAFLAGS
jgi:DnaJ-domain-containing protein 1